MKLRMAHGVIVLLPYLALVPAASAQTSDDLAQKASNAAELTSVANQRGHVRVIVEFAGPPEARQLTPDPARIASAKAQIASMQDAIIEARFGSANPTSGQGFRRGLLRFDITPHFAVNVNSLELESLAADPRVVHIELDRLHAPVLLQSVPLIGMTNAYTAGATGNGQAVAIIDTGVQSNHEFLAGKVIMEACFSNAGGGGGNVTLCPNGQSSQTGAGAANATTPQCINGSTTLCFHGTHVAGIAAGNNTNPGGGKPANGVAKDAKIVAVQVFTRFNSAADCSPAAAPCVLAFTSDMLSALNWVFQNGLQPAVGVSLASANMSIGGGLFASSCDTSSLKTPIDNLKAAGVATAIAAGNNGSTNQVSSPGCISTAVTVASSDKQDILSSFSNMAPMVDLVAPGGFGSSSCFFGGNNANILASFAGSSSGITNSYACLAGTSMATPHVAGAFAAMRSACPTKTVDQILNALQATGLAITDTRPGGTQTKPRIRVDLAVQQLGCGGSVRAATHDFDGDHRSDIVWRQTGGTLATWLMNGGQISQLAAQGMVPNNWTIVGQRDFDGDGRADILWRDTNTGAVAIWLMNGLQVQQVASVGGAGLNWTIVGTGDFNGDGRADILWRDSTTGDLGMWLMNGVQIQQIAGLGPAASNWRIVATGDFDGDGKYDILWQDSNTSTLAIWLMNGVQVQQVGTIGAAASPWFISDVGDFDGDGKWDILWRDGSDGTVAIWLMNGLQAPQIGAVGTVSLNWSIWLTGDFDGNGKSDILWRESSTGATAIWLMNGFQVSSVVTPGGASTDWVIQWFGAE